MPITPATDVTAPEPYGRRYGLITAAGGPLDLPAGRTGGDVQYEPISCGTARAVALDCVDQEDPETKTFDPGDTWITGPGFVVYSSLQCGAAGAGDVEMRVRRRLETAEQGAVERFLGEQLATVAETVAPPVPGSAAAVIGALEQWLYSEQEYGAIGFIHAPIRLASYVGDTTPLTPDSAGRFRTRMGTVVVFGDYPDNGDIYITGHTTLWRAADINIPPRAQVLNRTTNQLMMLAEREWAVAWDCYAGVATFDVEGMS